MADNIVVAGRTIATDEIAGVDFQRAKLVHGVDGVNDGDVALTNPYPVNAFQNTGFLQSGSSQLTPKFAAIDAAGSGDNTIVAAVSGKKIRVLSLHVTMTGTLVTIRFESGAAGTALTGQMQPLAGNSITLPYSPLGWFETASGVLLNMELGGAQSVDGCLVYIEV